MHEGDRMTSLPPDNSVSQFVKRPPDDPIHEELNEQFSRPVGVAGVDQGNRPPRKLFEGKLPRPAEPANLSAVGRRPSVTSDFTSRQELTHSGHTPK
jgi:hypothetical protein